MLVHLLAILDILAAGVMLLGHFNVVHTALLYTALYLVTKIIFFRDLLTFIDIAAAVYCVIMFFGGASGLTWLFMVYFFYKTSVWLFFTFSN